MTISGMIPRILLLMIASLLVTSCGSDPAGPDDGGSRTTISGRVIDENNRPIAGATVSGHGASATTDAQGLYLLKDVSVPSDRCFVKCTKDGYFTTVRAAIPIAGGSTPIEVVLPAATVAATVSSSSPGTVTLPEGGSIRLPANGFTGSNGSAYTGQVRLLARRLNPESVEFGRLFPGDINAVRTDGSAGSLQSYGVIIAELESPTGEKLQLASGSTATLTFPIPVGMQSGAPSEMPLWFIDESIGKWKEEGRAVRTGNTYVGDVKHFTPWNCDFFFGPPCKLHIRVLTRSGKPAGGVRVRVGQVVIISDGNGDVWAWGTQSTTAQAPPELNGGVGSTLVDVPCNPGENIERTLTIDGATISGLVLDCDGRALRTLVFVSWSTGSNFVATAGAFNMFVPAGVPLVVNALGGASQNVPALAQGDSVSIGNLIVCQGGSGGGRPGVGSRYDFEFRIFDGDGVETGRSNIEYRIRQIGQTFAGKSDVALFDVTAENGNRDSTQIAREANGDISFHDTGYPDLDWILLPVASHASYVLPPKVVPVFDDVTSHYTGQVDYEGTEQIPVGSATLLAHKVTVTIRIQSFDKDVPGETSVEVESYWYVPAIGFFAKLTSDIRDNVFDLSSVAVLTSYDLE